MPQETSLLLQTQEKLAQCRRLLADAHPTEWIAGTGEPVLTSANARVTLCASTGAVTDWASASTGGHFLSLGELGLNRYVLETVDEDSAERGTWLSSHGWRPEGWGRHGSPDVLCRRGGLRSVTQSASFRVALPERSLPERLPVCSAACVGSRQLDGLHPQGVTHETDTGQHWRKGTALLR